jgi:hypothetical protein
MVYTCVDTTLKTIFQTGGKNSIKMISNDLIRQNAFVICSGPRSYDVSIQQIYVRVCHKLYIVIYHEFKMNQSSDKAVLKV